LIKPNLGELCSLVGREELNLKLVDDTAKEIIDKGACEVIVVSMGPAGALLVTKELALQIMPPRLKEKAQWAQGTVWWQV